MIGVEQWAEIRRLFFVERRSKRAIHRLTGVHRDTITRAIESDVPPKYTPRAAAARRRISLDDPEGRQAPQRCRRSSLRASSSPCSTRDHTKRSDARHAKVLGRRLISRRWLEGDIEIRGDLSANTEPSDHGPWPPRAGAQRPVPSSPQRRVQCRVAARKRSSRTRCRRLDRRHCRRPGPCDR